MATTGKCSRKPYRCKSCGYEKQIGTNHWGECYGFGNLNHCPRCPQIEPTVWLCQEKPPEGMEIPEPWEIVRLGDVAEIIEGGK